MTPYEIVKESPEFIRDTRNKALLNRDSTGLKEYKMAKQKRLEQKKEILNVQDDINTLKNEIKDIKGMFNQILNALNSKEK